MNIQDLVRDNIKALTPYSSARDEYEGVGNIQLDANESPLETGLNRYPDPYQNELKAVMADIKGVDTTNIVVGNGSDELIDMLIRTFCEPGKDAILGLVPSYGMYEVSASINNIAFDTFALESDFSFSAEALIKCLREEVKIIFLCSPNNPTGNLLSEKEISKLLNTFKGIVVIDEAYIDFSFSDSWIKTLDKYPQLVVIQTLSKRFGLAGLRVGFAYSSKEIVTILNKVKPPYNVNALSQLKALEALQSINEQELSYILKEKDWLFTQLSNLDVIIKVYPSEANFFLVKVKNARDLYDYLISEGITVRDRSKLPNCEDCLRITVGSTKENVALITKLKAYKK